MSKLRLRGSTSGYTEIQASDVAGDNTLTLPTTADGTLVVADTNDEISVSGGNIGGFDVDAGAAANSVNLDASGRLLVGTSSNLTPGYSVQVAGTINATSSLSLHRFQDSNNSSILEFVKSRGSTVGTGTIVDNGDFLGRISFTGYDGTGYYGAARIESEVDGPPAAGDLPGRIVFSTTPSGSTTPVEAVRINNAGTLLVGVTSSPTKAGSGSIVADKSLFIGSANYGKNQIYVSNTVLTATTGTLELKFKSIGTTAQRSCYVKVAVQGRTNNNTVTNHPSAEYAFVLHQTNTGVITINGLTTIFEYVFVRATHFAFADLGGGECTITITNPIALGLTTHYKVEILSSAFGLEDVTVT